MKKRVLSLLLSVTLASAATQALPASAKTGNNNPLQRTESSFAFRDPTEQAFCERIAGWENVTLDECILLRTPHGGMQVLTPTKPYWVQLVPEYPWRIYLTGDNLPDADKVQEKWKEMLRAEHYPEKSLEMLQCKITPAEDGYDIMCGPYEYGEITLADCLRYFPEVACADIQYAYRTDDRPNEAFLFCFRFQCDRTPVPEDFPSLDTLNIKLSPG
ncbi:MAG: hypothetical protein IJM28_04430 [Lachnospiraceae bacterium]|nr:hypothetical protein [Lachnospiraceae bacterium]